MNVAWKWFKYWDHFDPFDPFDPHVIRLICFVLFYMHIAKRASNHFEPHLCLTQFVSYAFNLYRACSENAAKTWRKHLYFLLVGLRNPHTFVVQDNLGWPCDLVTSLPRDLMTSWPRDLMTSWPRDLLASWPPHLRTSSPLDSWPPDFVTSWPRVTWPRDRCWAHRDGGRRLTSCHHMLIASDGIWLSCFTDVHNCSHQVPIVSRNDIVSSCCES